MSKPTPSPAVVLLGGGLSALSVARSLGRRGIAVSALSDHDSETPVGDSKFVATFTDLTKVPPSEVQNEWRAALSVAPSGAVVMPCSDEALEFLARDHEWVRALGLVSVVAAWDLVLDMLDKAKTYRIATSAGIRTPRHIVPHSADDVAAAAREFAFPCAIKPLQSHVFRQHFPVKMLIASTPAQLLTAYARVAESGAPVMVTEVVTNGDDEYCSYYTYIDDDGSPLVHFTKRKLRQWPIQRGIGSYHVTKWDAEVAESGRLFATRAGLRGLVNVEFKRDGRDGNLRLIECNPRITAANELVRRAGVDFAGIAYDRALGRDIGSLPDSFRDGLHQWLPSRDFKAYREYRARGELTTSAWLLSLAHRQCIPAFALDDPMPLLRALSRRTRVASAGLPFAAVDQV